MEEDIFLDISPEEPKGYLLEARVTYAALAPAAVGDPLAPIRAVASPFPGPFDEPCAPPQLDPFIFDQNVIPERGDVEVLLTLAKGPGPARLLEEPILLAQSTLRSIETPFRELRVHIPVPWAVGDSFISAEIEMPKVSKKVVANMLAVVDGFLPTLPGGMDDADRREALLLAQALQGFSAKVPAFELPELPVPRQPTIKSFVRGSEDTFASPLLTPYELINKLISDPLFEFPGGGDEFHVDDMPTERFRSFGESPLSLAELAKDPLAKVLGSNEWKVWPKFELPVFSNDSDLIGTRGKLPPLFPDLELSRADVPENDHLQDGFQCWYISAISPVQGTQEAFNPMSLCPIFKYPELPGLPERPSIPWSRVMDSILESIGLSKQCSVRAPLEIHLPRSPWTLFAAPEATMREVIADLESRFSTSWKITGMDVLNTGGVTIALPPDDDDVPVKPRSFFSVPIRSVVGKPVMRSTVREEHSNRPAGQGHPPVAKAAPPMNELPPVKKSRDADQGPKGAPFSSSLEEFLRLRGKQVDPKESAAMQKEKPPSPLQISERATPLRTVDIAPGVTDDISVLRGGNAIETYPSAPPVPSLGPWTCLAHSNIIEKQELLLALENKHGIRLVEKSASIGEADLVLSSTTAALLVDAHDLTQRRERSRGPLLDASFRGDLQPFGAGVLDMIVKAAQQYQQVAVLIDLRGKAPVVQQPGINTTELAAAFAFTPPFLSGLSNLAILASALARLGTECFTVMYRGPGEAASQIRTLIDTLCDPEQQEIMQSMEEDPALRGEIWRDTVGAPYDGMYQTSPAMFAF